MNVKINGKNYKYNPENCFGCSSRKGKCNILTEKICEKSKKTCPFYKPKSIVHIDEDEIRAYKEKYANDELKVKAYVTKEQLEIMSGLESLAGYKETIDNAIELISTM